MQPKMGAPVQVRNGTGCSSQTPEHLGIPLRTKEEPSAGDLGGTDGNKGVLPLWFLVRETARACPNCLFLVENGCIYLTQSGPESKYLLWEGM